MRSNLFCRLLRVSRSLKDERAQSLIELACMMPVLLGVLLTMVELGRMAYAAIEVTSAAHAGAIYGSQNLFTAVDLNGMKTAAKNEAPDVQSFTGNALQASAVQACTCTNGTTITCSNAGSKCTTPARIEMNVQVNTQVTINTLFLYSKGKPRTYTLYGQSIMRVAQ